MGEFRKNKTIIIGAGLTGLIVAEMKKQDNPIILEKSNAVGGLARSFKAGDYIFDYGGHYLHFQYQESKDFFKRYIKKEVLERKRSSFVYIDKTWIPYPVQIYFADYFPDQRERVLSEITQNQIDSTNYERHLKTSFGSLLYDKFFFPYNAKLWKTDLSKIDARWTEKLIPKTDTRKIERPPQTIGYNHELLYPRDGIGTISETLAENKNVLFNTDVNKIDLEKKCVYTNNGIFEFDNLVSTMPLLELLKCCGLPEHDLEFLSVLVLNIGLKGSCPKDFHWVYLPEKDTPFYRLGKYLLPESPERHSFYFETSYRQTPPTVDGLMGHVKHLMSEFDIEGEIEEILDLDVTYAYPILKVGQKDSLSEISSGLRQQGVFAAGRMGSWRYISMEDSYLEAKRIISEIGNGI